MVCDCYIGSVRENAGQDVVFRTPSPTKACLGCLFGVLRLHIEGQLFESWLNILSSYPFIWAELTWSSSPSSQFSPHLHQYHSCHGWCLFHRKKNWECSAPVEWGQDVWWKLLWKAVKVEKIKSVVSIGPRKGWSPQRVLRAHRSQNLPVKLQESVQHPEKDLPLSQVKELLWNGESRENKGLSYAQAECGHQ